MDVSYREAAKLLASNFLKVNPGYQPASDYEQKAKLRNEIDQLRAQLNDLQQLGLAIAIIKNGVQAGVDATNQRDSLFRETQNLVHYVMEKHGKMQHMKAGVRDAVQPKDPPQENKLKDRYKELTQQQERVLVRLRLSRLFLLLEPGKKELVKLQRELQESDQTLQKARVAAAQQSGTMLQMYVDEIILIGEAQLMTDQKRAQKRAFVCRPEMNMNMDLEQAESVVQDPVYIGAGTEAPLPMANNKSPKDRANNDVVVGVGKNFSQIEQKFVFPTAFKNPNDYPDVLHRISSPGDYETMIKDLVKDVHKASSMVKQRMKLKASGGMVIGQQQQTEGTDAILLPSAEKKMKTFAVPQPSKCVSLGKKIDSPIEQIAEQENGGNKEKAKRPNGEENLATTSNSTLAGVRDKSSMKRAAKSSDGGTPSKLVRKSLMVPSVSVRNTASTKEPDPSTSTHLGDNPSSTVHIFMGIPTVKPTSKPPQQPTAVARNKSPPVNASKPDPKPQTSGENVRNLRTKRSRTPLPASPPSPVISKMRTRRNNTKCATMDGSSFTEQASTSGKRNGKKVDNSEQDLGLVDSSHELSDSISAEFKLNMSFEEEGFENGELDFLSNSMPLGKSRAANKNNDTVKSGNGDGGNDFCFDFEGQDSTDNMDPSGPNDIF